MRDGTACARWMAVVVAVCLFAPSSHAGATRGVTDVRGRMEVVVQDDLALGRSRTIYRLRDARDGKTYWVDFAEPPRAELTNGSEVTLHGSVIGDTIDVAEGSGVVVHEAVATSMDERRVLVMLVDFQDQAVACSDQTVATIMFSGTYSVDGLYRDSSFGAVSFPSDTDGDGQPDIVRLAIGAHIADSCDSFTWADEADAAAIAASIDLTQYQHRLYVLPQTSCTWAGQGSMGCGDSCRAWVDVCNMPDVYAHELGHNLEMRHASTDPNNDDTIDSTYGDLSDFMGLSGYGWRQVNPPHKAQMGWLPPAQVIGNVGGGTHIFVLSPLETDPSEAAYPQLIEIPRPAMGDALYLGYRRRIGYDVGLRTDYVEKTSVLSYDGGGNNTLFIGALGDGQEFDDATLGLVVIQVSHDTMSATLQITLPAGGCGGADGDGDGICDDVDACPADPDNDLDGDGYCVNVDCAPSDPSAYAAPTTIVDVDVEPIAGGYRFGWSDQSSSAGPGTVYDVLSGSLADVRDSGGFASAGCSAEDADVALYNDAGAAPAPGQGQYFLVRAQNACPAGSGSYGSTTRDGTALASSGACD